MGGIVAERHELEMDAEGYLVYKPTGGRIDVIYERIEDGRIYDTLPDLAQAQAAGRVQAVFPPNVDLADDKGVYPFVPEMIRRYLGEEPMIENLGTYSLAVEEDRRYVMENFDKLVIKSRGGWGGKGVLISPEETREAIEEFRRGVEENPVEFVAQEPLDFSTHVLCETTDGGFTLRDSYADYRVHAISYDQDTVEVVPGAMTPRRRPRQPPWSTSPAAARSKTPGSWRSSEHATRKTTLRKGSARNRRRTQDRHRGRHLPGARRGRRGRLFHLLQTLRPIHAVGFRRRGTGSTPERVTRNRRPGRKSRS